MALFNLGRKKEEPQQVITPVDEVLRMKEQGFSNNQIVQTLQRNGYKTHQIFDAMNQADLRGAGPIEGAVPPELAQQPNPGNYPGQENEAVAPPPTGAAPEMTDPAAQPPAPQLEPESSAGHEEQIEEIAEAIIDEKWEDLMKDINKLLEWKESIENRMAALEQGFKDLKSNYTNLQGSVVGKVAEYDKTMKTVGTDMKAMENVFQKILPTLTDNVNELSRITKKSKTTK